MPRQDGRRPDQIRPISITRDYLRHPEGSVLVIRGPQGSGRSVLLRRLAWSLGVEGRPLAWIDSELARSPAAVLFA